MEIVNTRGCQLEGLRALVGVEEDHGQTHPPLEVCDVHSKVAVPGDENDPGSISVGVSKSSHQRLNFEVDRILSVGGHMEDVHLGLVQLLQHRPQLLGDVTHHGELLLTVAQTEGLLPEGRSISFYSVI